MAYMSESVTFDNGLRLYNVDNAVGQRSNNLRGDVMLVQWFIRKVREHPMGFNGGPLEVDGDCGPLTKKAIKETQDELQNLGHAIKSDGRIDPVVVEFPKEAAYSLFHIERVCDGLYCGDTWLIDPMIALDSPPRLKALIRNYSIETHGGAV